MASNAHHLQQQFQQPTSQHHCKECGLFFDSSKSLEVHLQYHKENLLNKWATQASSSAPSDEANNNNPKNGTNKREFTPHSSAISAAADSSDTMIKSSINNKSPETFTNRTTPETAVTGFGHPPTPQSYNSAPSPYQTAEGATFSPNYQSYPVKNERASPLGGHYAYQPQTHLYATDPGQYYMEPSHAQHHQQLSYPQDYPVHKMPAQSPASFRYHPYQQHSIQYDRSSQVSSSSPAYSSQNHQPTPSPSPKQCDKCGCVCESAAQLLEHLNHAHPSTPITNPFGQPFPDIKQEDEPQTEILDLDSHKVHQVFQSNEEEEVMKRHNHNGEMGNPHSVSAMLNSWPNNQSQQKLFSPSANEHRMFMTEQKMFLNGQDNKMLFQPHQMQEFIPANGVTTTTTPQSDPSMNQYRYEQPSTPVSSTQITNQTPPNTTPVVPPPKGANWKSNEARRPKTYNCSACNKWFTSSGHLKRHYNTTLHKNAVKTSGQPDPATLPISAHHHPGRENRSEQPPQIVNNSNNQSPDPLEDSRDEFERTQMMPQNVMSPNGEAGPSATPQDPHSRGLLQISTVPTVSAAAPQQMMNNLGFGALPQQMNLNYPNAVAPHVMPTAISSPQAAFTSLGSSGEEFMPLPSFAQFQRCSLLLAGFPANVGGTGHPPQLEHLTFYDDNGHNYEITVIANDNSAQNIPDDNSQASQTQFSSSSSSSTTSPLNNNTLNLLDDPSHHSHKQKSSSLIKAIKLSPASPIRDEIKRDYENSSPRITSTGSPLAAKTASVGLHKCFDCDKMFNKACYLTQHNKTCHNGEMPFKCGRCGKRFPNDESYQEHLAKHAGDKPYKCELCPKQFNHKTDLRRHMCLHTGQKPYSCDHCGKGFIRKDHMLKHADTHSRKSAHSKHH